MAGEGGSSSTKVRTGRRIVKKKLAAFSLAVLAGFAVGRMTYQTDLTKCREELKACRQALTQREDELVELERYLEREFGLARYIGRGRVTH